VNKAAMMAVGLRECIGVVNKAAASTPEQITLPMRSATYSDLPDFVLTAGWPSCRGMSRPLKYSGGLI
jgi:hypothetical protein